MAVERPSLELGDPAGKVDDNPHYVRPADLHVRYAVLERPAYWECAVLGFQVPPPSPPPPGGPAGATPDTWACIKIVYFVCARARV